VCREGKEGHDVNAGFVYAPRPCPWPEDLGRLVTAGQEEGTGCGSTGRGRIVIPAGLDEL
jgi:hypothetical protein